MELLGVYSTTKSKKIGTGTTTHDLAPKTYWLVVRLDEGGILLRALSSNWLPTMVAFRVGEEKLLNEYEPEPEILMEKVLPALRSYILDNFGQEIIASPDACQAACLEGFGKLGVVSMKPAPVDNDAVSWIIDVVFKDNAVQKYEMRQKINAFGVALRKSKKLEESVKYYAKALELQPDDVHLHFNLARAYCDMGDLESAARSLREALKKDQNFSEAKVFLAYLGRKQAALLQEKAAAEAAAYVSGEGEDAALRESE